MADKRRHSKSRLKATIFTVALLAAAWPDVALATQGHGEPEGLLVHQMSHLFFAASMGVMIYWIRVRGLASQTGWRYIQYSAVFFIAWTLDAFTVHLAEEQFLLVAVQKLGPWRMVIKPAGDSFPFALFYYLIKLDHLLCVPALFFLYIGLRRLLEDIDENGDATVVAPDNTIPDNATGGATDIVNDKTGGEFAADGTMKTAGKANDEGDA